MTYLHFYFDYMWVILVFTASSLVYLVFQEEELILGFTTTANWFILEDELYWFLQRAHWFSVRNSYHV